MKQVYQEVVSLDKRCYDEYLLSEEILMEHAAMGLKSAVPSDAKSVLIVSGGGNNGADGIVLARLLYDKDVDLLLPFGVKSPMAKLQLERVQTLGINEITDINQEYDVVVDAIFGSGFRGELDISTKELISKLNDLQAYKIACDIPTGVDRDGVVNSDAFRADVTVTMGALKEALFSDEAKDFVGEIRVADLGVSSQKYEFSTKTYLLQEDDMKLPNRERLNTHKGDFGHLGVIAGSKIGAGVIAARSAFAFGVGKVTVVENEPYSVPYEIMSCTTLPSDATAVCIGMGLGNRYDDEYLRKFLLDHNLPIVVDADLFYESIITTVLDSHNELLLTPHPKEFCSLLKLTGIADITPKELQKARFHYAREFSTKYSKAVLVLKGANTLIAKDGEIYINSHGDSRLSKGGSGDVLSGLAASLLAQGYSPLQSAITASLAHTLALKNFNKNSYALTPQELIEGVKCL